MGWWNAIGNCLFINLTLSSYNWLINTKQSKPQTNDNRQHIEKEKKALNDNMNELKTDIIETKRMQ